MKKKSGIYNENKRLKTGTAFILILAAFACLKSPEKLYGAERAPINVNLIIDGSSSLSEVKDEVASWAANRLDAILVEGDNVSVWSAGPAARVIYSGRISGANDRDAVKNSIRQLSGSGETADFSGALTEAAARQSSGFSYTLLISASSAALSGVLTGPQSNLLRFSRMEEYSTWRALIVGLNIETRVRTAAAAFFNR